MKYFKQAFSKVFSKLSYSIMMTSIFFSFFFLDYFLLTRATSWGSFIEDNNPAFVMFSIILSLLNNFLISLALTYLAYVYENKNKYLGSEGSNTGIGVFLSLISVGCAVCGGVLLPLIGVAASLTAFPLQGLEIKILSIILLSISISQLSEKISGIFKKNLGREKKLYLLGISLLVIVYLIPRLPYNIKNSLKVFKQDSNTIVTNSGSKENLFDEINPVKGFNLNVKYGDLGPKMIASGAIDLDKFKEIYDKGSQPLTKEQLEILTKGSDKLINIDRDNSYFLLNFFWAVGLNNKSKVLDEGDIVKYGEGQVGNFASTGGWSLASGDPMNYYSKEALINLNAEQEALVQKVASNIYRPCCNNSTAFPDCNHGMALLGVLQLMAGNGATEDQMFEASKYINAYWFPSNYYDLALYFKNKEGKKFSQVPATIILGKDFSSSSGWQVAKQWLINKGIVEQPPKTGGGCGV